MENTKPGRAELLGRVAEIAALLDETAAESEQLRTLCPEAVTALHEKGLFGLWSPLEVGGYDADFVTQVDVMIEVARADMSACWTMMIGASLAAAMATGLPDEGLGEVFSGSRFATGAGSLKPSGRAEILEGGYRVTGSWGFGSGIHHANWVVANSLATRQGEVVKPVQVVALVIPIGEVEILDDWYVSGLSGSGSSSYRVADVFVPSRRAMQGAPRRGSLQNSNMVPRLPIEHASVSLGGVRRALDELTQQAIGKHRMLDSQSVAEKQAFQIELGRLEAEWRTLRDGVRSIADNLWLAMAEQSDQVPGMIVELRAICALATENSLQIGGRVLRQAGAAAVLKDNVLQRIHRDLTVSAQHFMISDVSYEDYGRRLLGVDRQS